ncbi:hypothetical protein [Mariniblastus fucicola]|uniref:Uncharacterized protein n=1 Tax=Mariniblastus fucicola TaxID=980251 RepID=A0A5B9P590_9BACT|nr:hypothetical protein [Mariniblastus fucicola]QEG21558.1 hypothetical protein MFFC18_14160 [Mariniblastus fucicola]
MSFTISIPVKDKPRGVVIADHGYPDAFEFSDNIASIVEFALSIAGDTSVAFWLPANAYATITVFKHFNEHRSPQFFFNYEVFHCNTLYSDQDRLDLVISDEAKDNHLNRKSVWFIECPTKSGNFVQISCDSGEYAFCDEGTAVCKPIHKVDPNGD